MLTSILTAMTWVLAQTTAPGLVASESNDFAVQLSQGGAIDALRLQMDGNLLPVWGATILEGLETQGEVQREDEPDGVITFRRALRSANDEQRCEVVERFSPGRDSIRWEVEIRGNKPFSTPITTRFRVPEQLRHLFWTAWSDPKHSDTDWHDPLEPQSLRDLTCFYGAPRFNEASPLLGYCPVKGDTFCIPLATVLTPAKDLGLSLVLSPEDTLLDLELATTQDGWISFARLNHRICKDNPVRFSLDIVKHGADPRAILGWMATHYPKYFEPPLPAAHDIAGCGAYSSYEGDLDTEKLRRMAFRVNWKASFDFPFMGMFLPPVPGDNDRWLRFNDKAPGQPLPGEDNWSSVARMAAYSDKMRGYGFYVLNYFNVTEFGVNLKGADAVTPGADKDPEAWRNGNDFTYTRVADGLLLASDGKYWGTWGAAVAMDPGGKDYQAFLLDQARRHVERLPASSGVCIDRMDWLRFRNPNADDGVSWIDGKPCRLLYSSWRDLMPKLAPIFHDAGKFVFVNNHLKRIDLLGHVDGIYCEFAHNGRALNSTGLLTVCKPAIGWTASVDDLKPDPDAFFQRYLHLGVFPTVPLSGNDHTITPNAWAEQYYLDYGPMLDALRGKRWVLHAHAVSVDGDAAKANLFAVPGGFVVPVTFGGDNKSVQIVLRGLPVEENVKILPVEVCHPGNGDWTEIARLDTAPELKVTVSLQRGCAMLRLSARQG